VVTWCALQGFCRSLCYLHAVDAHARGVVRAVRGAIDDVILVQQLVLIHTLVVIALPIVLQHRLGGTQLDKVPSRCAAHSSFQEILSQCFLLMPLLNSCWSNVKRFNSTGQYKSTESRSQTPGSSTCATPAA